MKFDRKEFRADVRRVLLSGHGRTVKDATREQLKNAVNQVAGMLAGFYPDADQFRKDVQTAVKDMFTGK